MISETQMPQRFRDVIAGQVALYRQGTTIQVRNTIPATSDIPLDDQRHWLRIPDVTCVYVDMLGSTRLSAENGDQTTAGAYQLFTGTAVRLFHEFDAPYIDVRGDGCFALFNSNQVYRALAAAVTFKTFAKEEFKDRIQKATGVEVGCHIGIDRKTVLVRRIGLRMVEGRTDRQNEVWAGKPVNMAAKLAAMTKDGELFASSRFFNQLKDRHALKSCGCRDGNPGYASEDLWTAVSVEGDDKFDFDTAYRLGSYWCGNHGSEYCEALLGLDAEDER